MGIEISFNENGLNISIGWLWFALILALAVFVIIFNIFRKKRLRGKLKLTKIKANLGYGEAEFRCDTSSRQIAYEVYVELKTRAIGYPIDLEHDTIVELYDSWYKAFLIIREAMKRLDITCADKELIAKIEQVLNEGLRSHLTKWQAKFRSWYSVEVEKEENKGKAPQTIQKNYEEYEQLTSSLMDTNKLMIQFTKGLYELAFGDNEYGKDNKH